MTLIVAGLLGLAAFWLLTAWRARVRERRAAMAHPPRGQFVTVDGRLVHAVVRGRGPDLVLIHGLSGNTGDFTYRLAGMLAKRYRVIAFDRPGLGWSDPLAPGQDGLEDQARHLSQAARLLGAERPIVLGHSYGGSVALAWAVYLPDRIAGLVTLSAPSHSWDVPMPLLYRINSSPLGSALAVPLITAWVTDRYVGKSIASTFRPQGMPPGYDRRIGAGLTLRRRTMRVNARHRARLKADIEAMVPAYPDLTLPFALIHGTADDVVSVQIHADQMIRQAPDPRAEILTGIGHMPHHVAPETVIAAVDRVAKAAGLA